MAVSSRFVGAPPMADLAPPVTEARTAASSRRKVQNNGDVFATS